jgi:hypothetical protein
MPTARILIWSLVAFLALGAVAFAAVAAWVVAWLRRARADRLGLAFDPVRPAPKVPVGPDPKAFFASKRLGNSEPGSVGKSN